jgi:hypothetical protein
MAHTGSTSQVETKREEQVTASCAEENRTGEEQNEAATSLVETAAARMCETVEIGSRTGLAPGPGTRRA